MRLLYVIHYPVFGGPHNEALRLAHPLRERGWQMTVLLPQEAGNASERLRLGGVDVVEAPLHRLRAGVDPRLHLRFAATLMSDVSGIRRLLRQRSIDLVLIGGLLNPHSAIAGRLEKVPVVWQVVDTRPPWLVRRAAMQLTSRLSDAVMFNGRALIHAHLGGHPLDRPYSVYYAPVDTAAFDASLDRRVLMREELGIPQDAIVVGTVANLNPQKGIEYFIRSASRVYRAEPKTRFLVVGASYETHRIYADRLMAELRRSDVPASHFLFAGERSDVENVYAAMDVKLITSVPRSEGTTTTAAEAMACRLPVVATDVGAVREVVEDGATGFIVPPCDVGAIADVTLRLVRDPSLRARLGEDGRRRAVERFDVSVCVDRYTRAFDAAVRRVSLKEELAG